MKLVTDTNNIDDYLKSTDIINYHNDNIQKIAKELKEKSKDNIDLVKISFEYVRDNISHSADINGKIFTCIASDVLEIGEGLCYTKSHLLAAILRANDIPTGFCYQKLILDHATAPYLIIHGLNAVYIESLNKWIRLDARGNRNDVNAQFSLNKEQLAFPVDESLGEYDSPTIYHEPDSNVVTYLNKYDDLEKLFNDLPRDLSS